MNAREWMTAEQLGLSRARLESAVRRGSIVRVRRGRYVLGSADPALLAAARLGCQLDCVSLLRLLGVFVLTSARLHIHAPVGSSRLPRPPDDVVRHWRSSDTSSRSLVVNPVDALAQACRCQEPRSAIATLDSALHLGILDEAGLDAVFRRLPRRFGHLRRLLDGRSESGAESLMRLVLRTLDCTIEVQVPIDGVGRVDFVVDGWLIVECDSRAHHEGWDQQRRDRRRDLAAAAQGYTTVRPLAEDIFHRRDEVRQFLAGTLSHGPRR